MDKKTLAILALVPFLMVLGNSVLFPIFPQMQDALHISRLQVSYMVTAFSIPAGMLIPFAGFLADRYGRRRVMVPSLFIFGAGALVAGLAAAVVAKPFAMILVGRVIQGAGAAGMSQLAMVLAADTFAGKNRSLALGTLEASNGIGKMISPILGGLIGLVSWFLPFYLFAALAVPVSLAIWFWVKEPKKAASRKTVGAYLGELGQVLRAKGVSLGICIINGMVILFLLFGTLFTLSEILEKTYKVPEFTVGFILALPTSALALTSYLTGRYLQGHQKSAKMAIGLGSAIIAIVLGAAGLLGNIWLQVAVLTALGLGGGLVLSSLNLLVTSSVAEKERGMVTSFYGGMRFLGVAMGPPLFGLASAKGSQAVFIGGGALALLAGGLVYFLVNGKVLLKAR